MPKDAIDDKAVHPVDHFYHYNVNMGAGRSVGSGCAQICFKVYDGNDRAPQVKYPVSLHGDGFVRMDPQDLYY